MVVVFYRPLGSLPLPSSASSSSSRVSQSDDRYRCQSGTPHGSSFSILVLSVDYQLIPPQVECQMR